MTAGTAKTTRHPKTSPIETETETETKSVANPTKKKKATRECGPEQKDQEPIMTAVKNVPDQETLDRRDHLEIVVLLVCLGVIAVVSVVLAWA